MLGSYPLSSVNASWTWVSIIAWQRATSFSFATMVASVVGIESSRPRTALNTSLHALATSATPSYSWRALASSISASCASAATLRILSAVRSVIQAITSVAAETNETVDTPLFLVAGGDFIEPLKSKFDLLRIGNFHSGDFFHRRPFLEKLCAPWRAKFFPRGYGGINFAKSRQKRRRAHI